MVGMERVDTALGHMGNMEWIRRLVYGRWTGSVGGGRSEMLRGIWYASDDGQLQPTAIFEGVWCRGGQHRIAGEFASEQGAIRFVREGDALTVSIDGQSIGALRCRRGFAFSWKIEVVDVQNAELFCVVPRSWRNFLGFREVSVLSKERDGEIAIMTTDGPDRFLGGAELSAPLWLDSGRATEAAWTSDFFGRLFGWDVSFSDRRSAFRSRPESGQGRIIREDGAIGACSNRDRVLILSAVMWSRLFM